jgi:hypothetical protein
MASNYDARQLIAKFLRCDHRVADGSQNIIDAAQP